MKYKKIALSFLICVMAGVGLIAFGCSESPANSELPNDEIEQPVNPDGGESNNGDSEENPPIVETPDEDEPAPDTTLQDAVAYVKDQLLHSGMLFSETYQVISSDTICTITISNMDVLDVDMLLEFVGSLQYAGTSITQIDDGMNFIITIVAL